jgi:diguanylate cyclase (GGDEF)-like protein
VNPTELRARVQSALKLKWEKDKSAARERELLHITKKLSEINSTLNRLSSVDVLTGIPNRSRFDEYLEHEWKCAIREGAPLTLLFVDLDCFKSYNDHFGHDQGDECLKLVARELQNNLKRPGDLLARYSGGLFAAVLTHTDAQGASAMADLLRLAVASLESEHPVSTLSSSVSVTVGAATAQPQRGKSPLLLILGAEQALFQAKKDGQNCARHKLVTA